MKNKTLIFAKNYKFPLILFNGFIVLIGCIIALRGISNEVIVSSFPWGASSLLVLDLWIVFCFITNGIIDELNLSYKKLIGDLFLIVVIFYNFIHVGLSVFFSIKFNISWYFFYGVYHLVLALALLFIYNNYKNKETKNSTIPLKQTSNFILVGALVFAIIMHFVLRDAEEIHISNRILIISFTVLTLSNLFLSSIFVIKLKNNTLPTFVAHKYMNLAAAIFSIFFAQTIYLNEFCESLPLDKMQQLTLFVGIPCFIALVGLAIRLRSKIKKIEYKK